MQIRGGFKGVPVLWTALLTVLRDRVVAGQELSPTSSRRELPALACGKGGHGKLRAQRPHTELSCTDLYSYICKRRLTS